MSSNNYKKTEYKSLNSSKKKNNDDKISFDSLAKSSKNKDAGDVDGQNLESQKIPKSEESKVVEPKPSSSQPVSGTNLISGTKKGNLETEKVQSEELSFSEVRKQEKIQKKLQKDVEQLNKDTWFKNKGHSYTYAGLFLFSVLVLFRPYELIPPLSFLSATALYFAVITLAFYLPTQFLTEGNITNFSIEVKAVLLLTLLAIISIPLAKSPGKAFETFNDMFVKAVLMFIVMVNVLRTRGRLMGIMWISLGVGLVLSFSAVSMFWNGELNSEGYRVAVDVGGMFGNPNDLAMHLVTMMPIAIGLGIAAEKNWQRLLYFVMSAFFIGAISVTYSRGGFLGLIGASMVLCWKLGRNNRFKIFALFSIVGIIFLILAPGNYGIRMLSIFIPGLDPNGSSSQRQDLLWRSIFVTLRNPWGIGIGNFSIVGVRNLETHNAYTQVSSEIGVLGLAAYLTFIISPIRKLAAIERTLLAKTELNWYYYVSIGLQASVVGFMISSFFGPVAYNWFIYYLIAYAVSFRRIYKLSVGEGVEQKVSNSKRRFRLQTASR